MLSAGISASRFGILVLSPAFFAKRWTLHELNMLEQLAGGEVVEVTLTDAAYVRLMDIDNFRNYRYLHPHNSYGGHYESSPIKLRIPQAGHWIVAVDLAG